VPLDRRRRILRAGLGKAVIATPEPPITARAEFLTISALFQLALEIRARSARKSKLRLRAEGLPTLFEELRSREVKPA
jgi:hypothetical protein